ncbi:RIIB lysis inhibitor [Erwinia phage vB_EamM-Bue1]|uniref:Lysis inhibitor n=1 Tax=Erwinia phage vB_EamM-Bue1 TaxID=2099338 RepID=A0A2P1JU20_9CAUD|nr:RIIB lysis inhibitor [Erwinia phage vB_EamM-Bue1]AVO22845.1 lysis inhibitor [Erwinia phage vB_EamM-Bue1]
MTPTELKIVKKLKAGESQSQIAKDLGVPRSVVQRVSDKELGVDAASLKSLTVDQIVEIQELAKSNNNAYIAKQFDVSPKTVARALLVRISNHANNVTVISPIGALKEDGAFDTTTDLQPGGVAKLLSTTSNMVKDTLVYIGAFLEARNSYLIVAPVKGGKREYVTSIVKHAELEAIERGFESDQMADMSTLVERIIETGVSSEDGVQIVLRVEGTSTYPLKGKFNSKGQIGYHDTLTNMTVRVALSRVSFDVRNYEVTEQNAAEGESTGKELKGTDLDAFLGKHQILITDNQVIVSVGGKPLTITSEHPAYEGVVKAIKEGDIKRAYEHMEPRKQITKFSQGRLLLDGKSLTWDGHRIDNQAMAKRFLAIAAKGDIALMERFAKFLDKVFDNPSAKLVMSGKIFKFMEYLDIEVDEDGDIFVYKVVRSNYMDKHSGTISNAPGTVVRMARSFVNDDNASLCSYGLHVCSLAYIKKLFGNPGDRVLRCKLNPRDIVSITDDYNSSKIRCCEYLVLEDFTSKYNSKYAKIDMDGFYK